MYYFALHRLYSAHIVLNPSNEIEGQRGNAVWIHSHYMYVNFRTVRLYTSARVPESVRECGVVRREDGD